MLAEADRGSFPVPWSVPGPVDTADPAGGGSEGGGEIHSRRPRRSKTLPVLGHAWASPCMHRFLPTPPATVPWAMLRWRFGIGLMHEKSHGESKQYSTAKPKL